LVLFIIIINMGPPLLLLLRAHARTHARARRAAGGPRAARVRQNSIHIKLLSPPLMKTETYILFLL
jgi:hypothetical protein